jgi:threonine synthase
VASAVGEPLTIEPQLSSFNAAWERAQSLHRATWEPMGV